MFNHSFRIICGETTQLTGLRCFFISQSYALSWLLFIFIILIFIKFSLFRLFQVVVVVVDWFIFFSHYPLCLWHFIIIIIIILISLSFLPGLNSSCYSSVNRYCC